MAHACVGQTSLEKKHLGRLKTEMGAPACGSVDGCSWKGCGMRHETSEGLGTVPAHGMCRQTAHNFHLLWNYSETKTKQSHWDAAWSSLNEKPWFYQPTRPAASKEQPHAPGCYFCAPQSASGIRHTPPTQRALAAQATTELTFCSGSKSSPRESQTHLRMWNTPELFFLVSHLSSSVSYQETNCHHSSVTARGIGKEPGFLYETDTGWQHLYKANKVRDLELMVLDVKQGVRPKLGMRLLLPWLKLN